MYLVGQRRNDISVYDGCMAHRAKWRNVLGLRLVKILGGLDKQKISKARG